MSQQEFIVLTRIEQDRYIVIPRRPRIAQQLTPIALKLSRRIITQKLKRGAQRLAPLLIPTRLTTSVTPTVSRPTRNPMHATPRTPFTVRPIINLNRQLRRMVIEILRVVRDPKTGGLGFNPQRMGQTEIAKLEVMPVSLTVSRNVYKISEFRRSHKPLNQSATRGQCALERNRARKWSIVEKHCQRTSRSINVTKQVRL